MLGEGLGVVALKRLTDALADGDRIYAVLRAIGSSSDGRGQGLLAPRLEGEILAIRRAYEIAGVEPASIRLVEAHGTGIPLGDRTEIGALTSVF
jgi:acyl transferase domain-containing protein